MEKLNLPPEKELIDNEIFDEEILVESPFGDEYDSDDEPDTI